ncbi:MAG: hypothetical protein K8F59_17030 [Rhodobacteraceae bacterium]|nr:hypothetical protein [Paracoccaceae bacterium]
MTDLQAIGRIFIGVAIIVGLFAFGYIFVFVILPVSVLVLAIDFSMRYRYNAKLQALIEKGGLTKTPKLDSFEVRLHEGKILIGWKADLPNGATLSIYRLEGSAKGTVADIEENGECLLSTTLEMTDRMDNILIDHDAPDGVLYYVPTIFGESIEERPLDYSFLDFFKDVKFSTRKSDIWVRGQGVRLEYQREPAVLPDGRDEAVKMADDILQSMRERKKREFELDAAVERIRQSPDLSDAEKEEAVELLETHAVAQ